MNGIGIHPRQQGKSTFRYRLLRAFVVLTLGLAMSSCTALFFYPQKQLVRSPAALGLDYENIAITTRDGLKLHGWWVQPSSTPRGSVYFLHGNAENISTHIASVVWMVEAGFQVFLLDYRGYGLSEGLPDIPEVFEDIRAGAEWLLMQEPARPLIVFGQSLGASLAISALQQNPEVASEIDGLVSEAAFSEYGRIAREVAAGNWITWAFQYPVDWLLKGRYDPLDAIARLRLPILLIHSTDDDIIGFDHARTLSVATSEQALLLEATGPHIQAMASASIRAEVLAFIARLE